MWEEHKRLLHTFSSISLPQSGKSTPFMIKRIQFPVMLSFVIAINKSQGKTFAKVGIYLLESIFLQGTIYAALFRRNYFVLKSPKKTLLTFLQKSDGL